MKVDFFIIVGLMIFTLITTDIKPLFYHSDNGIIVRLSLKDAEPKRFSTIKRYTAHHSYDISALDIDHGVMVSGRGGLSLYSLVWDADVPLEVRPYLTYYNKEGQVYPKNLYYMMPLALFDVEFTGPEDIGLMWKLMR